MAFVMNMKDFLTKVLPDTGPYCLAFPLRDKYPTKVGHNGKPLDGYGHRAIDTIDDFVTAATSMCFVDKLNVYFGTHGLINKAVPDGLRPDGSQKMKVHRTHENMREGRTFFNDLDVGDPPEKGKPDFKYRTKPEALAALERFVFVSGLPCPLVVDSGGGYHVYWLLAEAIESVAWRELADRMRWLLSHHGMKFDPSRTTDQSSVLRVVGTKNLKPHVMAKVRALTEGDVADNDTFIATLVIKTDGYTPLSNITKKVSDYGNLGAMFDGRVTPMEDVYEVCEQMRYFRDNAASLSEPEWFAGLGVTAFVDNGVDLSHELSQADPRYDSIETQNKIDHQLQMSVTSCSKIEATFANDACSRCPFKGQGKNPVVIANKEWSLKAKTAATPSPSQLAAGVIPMAPIEQPGWPYKLANAGVTKESYDAIQKVDVDKLILPYYLFPIAKYRAKPGEPGHSTWCVTLPLEGQQTFDIDDVMLHDNRNFGASMMGAGVIATTDNQRTELKTFMLHYIKTLQSKVLTDKTFDFYGWDCGDEGRMSDKRGFVLHRKRFDIAKKEWRPAAMAHSMKDGDQYMTRDGSFQGHYDALQFFNRPMYRHLQFAYLVGLSTPFLYATGEHGALISLSGRSGASKSTMLVAVASQWAMPERYVMSGSPSGPTANARIGRMMRNANLPFLLDEVTLQNPEAINEMVLSVSQSGGRIRLKQDGSVREQIGGIRYSVVMCSTNNPLNTSLTVNAAGEASTARLMEVDCIKGMKSEKTMAEAVAAALRANYGWTGPMMIENLVPDHGAMEAEIKAMSVRLSDLWELDPVERFTGFVAANMYVVAQRTAQLGLHPFDPDGVIEWFQEVQLPAQRQHLLTQSQKLHPVEIVSTYLSEFHGEAVRVDLDTTGNIKGVLHIPPGRNLAYRYNIHDGEVWIRSEHFNNYLSKIRRLAAPTVVGQLTSMGVISGPKVRKSFMQGIPNQEPVRPECYVLDLKHPAMSGIKAKVT